MLAGLPDRVARKILPQEIKETEDRRKFKYAYRCPDMEDPVFVNPSSILRHSAPEWIVYQVCFPEDFSGHPFLLFSFGAIGNLRARQGVPSGHYGD